MVGTYIHGPTANPTAVPSAVVWINGRQAVVALMSYDGHITTCDISRGWLSQRSYLAQVVRVIGDRPRVVMIGPGSTRLALEREYVTLFRCLDHLVDVEPAGPVSRDELVARVRTLAT